MIAPGSVVINPATAALDGRPARPHTVIGVREVPISGDFTGRTRTEITHDGIHWGPLQGHVEVGE